MRLTAVWRSLNFLTGLTPGRLFQISTSREAGQSAASLCRPDSFRKRSAFVTASASCTVAWAVMLFESFSIVRIFMVFCPLRGSAALTSITRVARLSKAIVLEIERWRMKRDGWRRRYSG
jgi:hypothetical protein